MLKESNFWTVEINKIQKDIGGISNYNSTDVIVIIEFIKLETVHYHILNPLYYLNTERLIK